MPVLPVLIIDIVQTKNLAWREPDKLNLKFIEIQEVNTHLKNKVRGLACLNIKTYLEPIVWVNTV